MDSYANWVEIRCRALIYNRVARDWRKYRATFDYGIMQKRKANPALRVEPPCFFLLIDKEEKKIFLNRLNPLNKTSEQVNLVFSR